MLRIPIVTITKIFFKIRVSLSISIETVVGKAGAMESRGQIRHLLVYDLVNLLPSADSLSLSTLGGHINNNICHTVNTQ